MTSETAPQSPFPCPFCRSARVLLLGGGLVFLHYKCGECAEVWTAMAETQPAILRPASVDAEPPFASEGADEAPTRPVWRRRTKTRRKEKLWLN